MTFPFFAGLLASMLHVIMGPDHIAAVIPFAIEAKRKAWKIGLFWGLGHIFGMLLIGLLFLLFKDFNSLYLSNCLALSDFIFSFTSISTSLTLIFFFFLR